MSTHVLHHRFSSIVIDMVALAALALVLTGVARAQPLPTATEGVHAFICGNGILDPNEQCDDGNLVGGDGCAADCTVETVETKRFAPFNEGSFSINGSVTIAKGQLSTAFVIKAFVAAPSRSGDQYLCLRGIVDSDQFGPGNVGSGFLGGLDVSRSIINAHARIAVWSVSAGSLGPDDRPCTDDDPTFSGAQAFTKQLTLALADKAPCNGDEDGDGQVTISELISAVNNALWGCLSSSP